MIINGIICNLMKNCHGRLEVLIDDTNTDEYIGFDQHIPLAYALYKTLERYFKHNTESYGNEDDEKSDNNLDCQNDMYVDMDELRRNFKNKTNTNQKLKTKKRTSSNGSECIQPKLQ